MMRSGGEMESLETAFQGQELESKSIVRARMMSSVPIL